MRLPVGMANQAAYVLEIYGRYAHTPSFISELTLLISQETTQSGATWLLKHYLEAKQPLGQAYINEIYRALPLLVKWDAKLHVLQSIQFMPIANSVNGRLHTFFHACLTEKNKFVRAWAYNGFYELALQHLEYIAEAQTLLESAQQEEAASVKARVRNILKRDAKGARLFQKQ